MVLAAVFIASLLLLIIGSRISTSFIRWSLYLAFAARLAFVFLLMPYLDFLYLDVSTFHSMTIELLAGGSPSFATSVESFIGLQAILYLLFGENYYVVSAFNSLASVLIAIPIIAIARELYPESVKSTNLLAVLILFLPIPLVQLSLPLRDAVGLLLFFTLLALIVFAFERDTEWAIPAVPLWASVYLLRSELAYLVLLGAFAMIVTRVAQAQDVELKSLTVIGGIVGIAGFGLFGYRYSVDSLARVVEARASGDAAYLEGFTYTSWFDVAISAPVRALYFQYAPFPFHVSDVFDLVPALMLPVLVVLTIAAYRSLLEANPNVSIAALLLTIYLGGIVGYGLIDSNFGTTIRHRVPFVFLLALFSSPVLSRWDRLLRDWFDERPDEYRSQQKHDKET